MEAAGVAALKAPFPAFGSKAAVASRIWEALGNPAHYIEPFCFSAAVLLARPHAPGLETINDLNDYVVNFWRAVQAEPEAVARWADYPVHETDLHARHRWLMQQADWHARMVADPDYYDAKIAGWWVWGLSAWIGSDWCQRTSTKIPHISNHGRGIHRKRPHLSNHGQGMHAASRNVHAVFAALCTRLRRVRICCGDWTRVCTPVVLAAGSGGLLGIFLDPPYAKELRDTTLYAVDTDPAQDVAAWARSIQDRPNTRIVLAGYAGEHDMPGWHVVQWTANGGYGNQGHGRGKANARKECLWFSPQCARPQLDLFGP